jgi:hypothetical protein
METQCSSVFAYPVSSQSIRDKIITTDTNKKTISNRYETNDEIQPMACAVIRHMK